MRAEASKTYLKPLNLKTSNIQTIKHPNIHIPFCSALK